MHTPAEAHGSSPCIAVVRDGSVAWVTIDNAAKGNSLTSGLLREFIAAFESLAADATLGAVVVSGAGERAFVGGASLDEMAALDAVSARSFIELVHGACASVRHCPVPVIARIQGHALGAGLELAASCDIRIASRGSVFGMPEVRFGIPSVVEAALLPRLLGRGRAAWLVLTGKTLSADEALGWGLVEQVVEPAALDAALAEVLATILALSPQALRAQKALLGLWDEKPLDEGIAASIDVFARSYETGEPNARMLQFLESRRAAKR